MRNWREMSLTKLLIEEKDKRKFREFFPKPEFKKKEINREILAPPIADNKPLVGTAFDYLLHFLIKSSYKHTISNKWVSEKSLQLLNRLIKREKDKQKIRKLKKHCTQVESIILNAKKTHSEFLLNGKTIDSLLETTLLLAQVDNIYRVYEKERRISINVGNINKNDIKDLERLFSILKLDDFQLNNVCFLNPYFGKATSIVADADLIIGDTIIDIKTIKNLEMRRDTFNQLIGYYILSRIAGINGIKNKIEIRKIGVYFSRYAYLHIYNIEDIISETKFLEFIKWFKKLIHQNKK
ncbi:hypothetical protein LCGC14_1603690 [marine sediment metagenome]|uniref:PD-(D/E)XK endonuclease-like domain-containing protein n=1 Tax=marine sediment metagenome TaxID=412755 RepID=A0A0F9KR71_9ZZZZ